MTVTIGLPPLAGREDEVKILENALSHTFSEHGRFVLIGGEAGIGKTRLVEELAKLASGKGASVMVGKCLPGAPSPYLPFRDAFEKHQPGRASGGTDSPKSLSHRYPRENGLGISAWLKGPGRKKGESLSMISPTLESERTLHSALEFLQENSKHQPMLLVLEDLHWADSASTQLLHFLARNSDAHHTLLVGTYRPEEALAQASDKTNPLVENLRAMRREGLVQELELDRLTSDELRIAAEGMLNGKVDKEVLSKIADESDGNALFAVETIRMLAQSGAILNKDGVWRFAGKTQINLPPTVKEVIIRRIEHLSSEQRTLLESAAILGDTFDPDILRRILGVDKLALLESLDTIARHYQLISHLGAAYRFGHDKIRQTLYDEISVPRRTELHRRAGGVIETLVPEEAHYGQLSTHFYYAQDQAKCRRFSVLAGISSLKNAAPKEAVDYFERTLEIAPLSSRERQQALEGAGDAYRAMGAYDKAISRYGEFAELARDPNDRARGFRKSAEINYRSKLNLLLDQAEKTVGISDLEIGRIKRARGHLALSMGSFEQAQQLLTQAQNLYEKSNAEEDLGYVSLDLAAVSMALGKMNFAQEEIRKAGKILSSSLTPGRDLAITKQQGDLYFTTGRIDEALECYAKVIEFGEKYDRYPVAISALSYRSGLKMIAGDYASSERDAALALEYSTKTESIYDRVIPGLMVAHLKVLTGGFDEAEKIVQEISVAVKTIGVDEILGIVAGADQFYSDPAARFYSVPFLPAHLTTIQALLLAGRGDWTRSNELFEKSLEFWKGSVHAVFFGALAHRYYGWLLLVQGRASEGREHLKIAREAFAKIGNQPMIDTVVDKPPKLSWLDFAGINL